jgi:hypothetical protein
MSRAAESVTLDAQDLSLWRIDMAGTSQPARRLKPAPQENWTTASRQDFSEHSTALQETPVEISRKIAALFEAAKDQYFEDGMESEFSKGLIALVEAYGSMAVHELAYLILFEKVNAEVASEALRWMGNMPHSVSFPFRLWLLERSLLCSSSMVRDGAILGLASLDDPRAIPYIKRAMEREQCEELRKNMEQVLVQLERGH